MSERRQSIRRTVCLDDVRDKIHVQGLCQVELTAAIRALAFELRGRLGIWAAQASDEVLAKVEDRLKHNVVTQAWSTSRVMSGLQRQQWDLCGIVLQSS
ncbi:unnamed protein product [Symbiodinium necroappetens]|uniref:Uncharacterized protein n=1 Tax=Symbiodinium necroappetens TaxID=1628268 RepID=A0A812SRG6_9DINO|nr:unnamed protein product [Symbiodinium microadriaticum]CAE7497131.1 unnamed protein product [Symbiodinium necroappetens]CAE7849859.1 unnamed protein product [Symbiodinium sp. KB8]